MNHANAVVTVNVNQMNNLIFDWDYVSYNEKDNDVQIHWNQTLVTAINQIAARIRKELSIGSGAKKIFINEKLLPLFETLAFFKNNNGVYSLSGRFHINIDNKLPNNQIKLSTDNETGENIVGFVNVLNYNKNE